MRNYLRLHHQIFIFFIIGLGATCIHYIALYTFIEGFKQSPLIANIIAYLIAFQVSYYGHRYRTFSYQQPHPRKSYVRFIIASLTGLSLNEMLFYCFFVLLSLPYTMAFIATSLVVIPITFSIYKFWSFAKN